MSASTVTKIKKKFFFKSKKKLNSVLVQNNQILEIYQYLQANLQRFRDYEVLLCRQLKNVLAVVQIEKQKFAFLLLQFYDAAKTGKKSFSEANIAFRNKHCNVIVITFYSPSCLGQETAKGPFGHRVKLPPAHLSTTHGGGFMLSL